jgi:hypothetical protein
MPNNPNFNNVPFYRARFKDGSMWDTWVPLTEKPEEEERELWGPFVPAMIQEAIDPFLEAYLMTTMEGESDREHAEIALDIDIDYYYRPYLSDSRKYFYGK